MSIEELREIFAMTVELTRLRQNECKHLAVENFAPELLGKLIRERLSLGMPAPDEALRLAVERTRDDLGPTGDNYPAVRKLLDFAERAIQCARA